MNKDVIYIEPEQDITDILANIKAAKNKIIALVPPKKAGVLRSAVNFKLIAKAARRNEKTVVLITADESLRRLAASVAMPVAKTLQSKPQLPDVEDVVEFGDKKAKVGASEKDDVIEGEPEQKEDSEEEKEVAAPTKKIPVATAVKVKTGKKAEPVEEDVIEGEPEPKEESDEPKTKKEKTVAKMKGAKIPNIAKYRKFIIAGGIALILLIGFCFWANVIAPAAKITVTVHATTANFAEKVTFVDNEEKADPKSGILFLEQKSVTKRAEADFEATGEVDKGTKATGTITVTRPKGDIVNCDDETSTFSIPKGTTVKIGDKQFVVTEGGSANAGNDEIAFSGRGSRQICSLKSDVSSGAIAIAAVENGEDYNVAASTSVTLGLNTTKKYSVSSSAMAGGSSKKVKVVSIEDLETASSGLSGEGEKEAREELSNEFGADYVFLGNMEQSDPKVTSSPNVNEEVGDNITPKVVREVTYTLYAVSRESVNTYIKTTVEANLGDDTQEVYDTGADKAFFEAFKNSDNDSAAKLKSTTKTGPRVTEEMVAEKSLGKKIGDVRKVLSSFKGVSNVDIDTSYFWVSSVPSDTNKVSIEVKVEE